MLKVPQITKIKASMPQKIELDRNELFHLLDQRGNVEITEEERYLAREYAHNTVSKLMEEKKIDFEALSQMPLIDQIKAYSDLRASHYKAYDISRRLMKSSQLEYSQFSDPLTKLNQISRLL